MKRKFAVIGLAVACLTLPGVRPQVRAGTWSPLVNPAPDKIDHFMLLSDGTVLAAQYQRTLGSNWYRLTPDSFGSYHNGTWTNIAPMHFPRMFFSSTVLKDGRVFVAGSEYGINSEYGTNAATAEIYNPLSNTWTLVSPPASLLDPTQVSPGNGGLLQSIADANCKVLPNGQVLLCPAYPNRLNGTLLYEPVANSWTAGAPSHVSVHEASMVKLPDGSILMVDPDQFTSERYLPALNTWTNDASTSPADLWASLVMGETGPAFLLPDGRAIFFGGSGQTALYTPSWSNGPGAWVPGPNIPTNLVAAHTAGAMMANGNILLAVAPPPYVTTNFGGGVVYPSPLSFYEYDYSVGTTGAFTQVSGLSSSDGSYVTMMLDLPDGTVLSGVITDNQLYQYQPSGSPLAAGKPVISTITTNGDGSYHLTGRLFNGISEGAAFGDDHQMDSNFPLVRFIDSSSHVRYGRTYNWSRTGVMTGSAIVSTECMPPPGASLTDTIQVVANGIASDGVTLVVTTTADSGLGSLRQVAGVLQGGGTVTFASNLSGQTITLTSGEIAINNNLTIDASPLPNGIIINGNHNSRIFDIAGGAAVTLNALVLTNGYAIHGNPGGAILNAGTLALNYCTLAGNSGDLNVSGGAIANQGPLTVLGCTFSGNSAAFSGAIDNRSACTLKNSTFYGNVAFAGNGGAIDNAFSAKLSVLHCTFSANSASGSGDAIDNYLSQVNLSNSILYGNSTEDIANWSGSTIDAGGANIISALTNAGTLVGGATISTANPMLGPLTNNGGRTLSMMPQPGSPAIDAGVTSLAVGLANDQRGPAYPRVLGSAVDLGALEYKAPPVITSPSNVTFFAPLSNSFTLTATGVPAPAIAVSGTFPAGVSFIPPATLRGTPPLGSGGTYSLTVLASNGVPPIATQYLTLTVVEPCTNTVLNNLDSGPGSLRDALANATNFQTITFCPDVTNTINLTSGEMAITKNLTIDASALPNGIIINGSHNSRIFNIGSNAAVTLNALVLTNGYSTNGNWGGAILNAGTLALNYCTLAGNSGDSSVPGGAIANQGSLTVLGCMFSGNSATEAGAIYNFHSACKLLNSTFYGNIAFNGYGGAIENLFGSTLSVLQCTFSSNSSSLGGGIVNFQSQLNVTNSILSGNSGQDIFNYPASTIDAGGANIIPALGNAGTLVGGGAISSAAPMLGPLTNNGGRTLSMMPQPGSPAIDAGVTSLAVGLAYDQRGPGYPRADGIAVDIGALEHAAPPIIRITSPSNVTFLTGLSNSFTLTAAGALAPTIAVAGRFPPGVGFTAPALLSGTPPDGSGGAYPLLVTATNAISPNATQHLTVNIVERKVFAAHPSFYTNGLGWALNGDTVNGGPQITNDVFTLTDGSSGENRSGWFGYPLYVGAFEASFTYSDVGGYGADGVGFVIQNDPRGPTALGLAGGGLAYAGITSSVALLLNIYPGAPGGPSGLMLGTNGVGAYDASSTPSGKSYQSTAPVNLDLGNPIAVALRYTGGILHVSLTDTVTSVNFQTNIAVDVAAFTGTNVAWVGITGSDGGVLSHQIVSNFSYVPLPVLLSNPDGSGSLNLSWPASIYGYHLQSTSNLLGNVWADLPATVTQTNGFNLAAVAVTGNSQFFRLVLPP